MRVSSLLGPFSGALLCICVLIYSCKDDESQNPVAQDKAMYTSNDQSKKIVETITTSFSTGFNAVFSDSSLNGFSKVDFCKNFLHPALFNSDFSGAVTAEGFDGVTIANPLFKQLEGTSIMDALDADSIKFVPKMIGIARHAEYGFLTYNFVNPKTSKKEQRTTFVKSTTSVNGYLSSSYFHTGDANLYSANAINQVLVKEAVVAMSKGLGGILKAHAKDSMDGVMLIRGFLKNIRFFDNQSGYFYVIDFNGYNVAQPPNPAFQGTYELDLQDSRGNFLVRGLIETAKGGGGFYEYYWINYQTNKEELKRAYAVQIPGTNYLIGAGVYLSN